MDTFPPFERPTLRGLDLRSAVVVLLLARQRPATLVDLASMLRRDGFDVGPAPTKTIADALRWEVRRGRVARVGRGIYAAGTVAKASKHRMRTRVAAARNRTTTGVG